MRTSALSWPVSALADALAPWLPGVRVEVAPEIDSSNSELMRRARAGALAPTLLVAEIQNAGRGRLGRRWHSDAAGAALTFSLGLPLAPRGDWSGLSLAMILMMLLRPSGLIPARARYAHAENMKREGAQ